MNIWQAFKMAFKSIAMKKTRSFLTMLGIIIGVASVVIMVSVVQGQNKKNMEYWQKMGDNKIELSAYSWMDTENETGEKLFDYCLSLSDLVLGVTPNAEINDTVTIQYGARTVKSNDWENIDWNSGQDPWATMLHIYLGSDQYGICNNYTLAGGREISSSQDLLRVRRQISYLEVEKTLPVCVLGSGAKEQLFGFTDPVGETVTLNGEPFQVVGWYESMDIDYWPEKDNIIVIPYTFNRTMNRNNTISEYVIKAKDAKSTVEALTKLDSFLSGLFPKDENGNMANGSYYFNNNDSYAQEQEKANLMQSLVLGAIAGISLLVGGIGIMNIMLVTVTERTREIGIKKSIGAPRWEIIGQFLLEAGILSSLGGLVGIALGFVLSLILGKAMYGLIVLPGLGISLGAFAFSLVIGVVFGIYPAVKASNLQPVDALRAD